MLNHFDDANHPKLFDSNLKQNQCIERLSTHPTSSSFSSLLQFIQKFHIGKRLIGHVYFFWAKIHIKWYEIRLHSMLLESWLLCNMIMISENILNAFRVRNVPNELNERNKRHIKLKKIYDNNKQASWPFWSW